MTDAASPRAGTTPGLRAAQSMGVALGSGLLLVLVGLWSMQFRAETPPVPLVWPAAGLALAFSFLGGPPAALGAAAGAAALHGALGTALPAAVALGFVTGLAGLVGARLLRRLRFDPGFWRVRDALLLLVVGGAVTTGVNAAGGAFVVAGLTPAFPGTFGLCWIADAIGLVLLAPPVLSLGAAREPGGRAAEAAAWIVAGAGFVYLVFADVLSAPVALAASHGAFPLVLAGALRFGVTTTGLLVAVIAAVALTCTGLGKGPFAQTGPTAGVLALHAYLAMLGLTGLILASARRERDRAQARARDHLHALSRAGRLDAMSALAAGIAHEINQPLAAVNAYAHAAARMLREGRDPDELAHAMDRIVAGNRRAAEIVRRIRRFLGSGDGERQPVPLEALVRDAMELTEPEFRRLGVGSSLTRAAFGITVHADPVAIRQVLVNLLRNALEALTEARTAQPEVRVLTGVTPDGAAELVVEDNGPGLPAELRETLFDPLVTSRSGGTGLGLAIVRSLVEAHQGSVAAEDGAEGGARFVVHLPRTAAP